MITILKSLTQAICHVWGICRYPDKGRSSNRSKAFRDVARGGGESRRSRGSLPLEIFIANIYLLQN